MDLQSLSHNGVTLEAVNTDLTSCIQNLKEQRACLAQEIDDCEEEKIRLQGQIKMLSEQLQILQEGLENKYTARNEFDRTIQDTEDAYRKIIESSRSLLHVLKRETSSLVTQRQRGGAHTRPHFEVPHTVSSNTTASTAHGVILKDVTNSRHRASKKTTKDKPSKITPKSSQKLEDKMSHTDNALDNNHDDDLEETALTEM